MYRDPIDLTRAIQQSMQSLVASIQKEHFDDGESQSNDTSQWDEFDTPFDYPLDVLSNNITRPKDTTKETSWEEEIERFPLLKVDETAIEWFGLPYDIAHLIFGYFDCRDRGRIAQVCKRWYDMRWNLESQFDWKLLRGKFDVAWFMRLTKRSLNLRTFKLSHCTFIPNEVLDKLIVQFTNLRHLDLSGTRTTSQEFLNITKSLYKLQHLDISFTAISERGLMHLRQSSTLRSFILSYCQHITLATLSEEDFLFTTLRKMDLTQCRYITDRGLYHVIRMPHLRELILSNNQRISVETLQQLSNAKELHTLHLSFLPRRVSTKLTVLSGLTHLLSLKLEGTQLSSQDFEQILKTQTSLRTLILTENSNITKSIFNTIQLPSLEQLIFDGVKINSKN
jgi:hypothetical protein